MKFLKLPEETRLTFKRHFIKSCHLEFRFAQEDLDISDKTSQDIASKLSHFGFSETQKLIQGKIKIPGPADKNKSVVSESKQVGVAFLNRTDSKEFHVSSGRIIYADFKYSSFENFTKDFFDCLKILQQGKKLPKVIRVGLRKINSLRVDNIKTLSEATSLFNPSLFGVARSDLFSIEALTVTEDSTVIEDEKFGLILKTRMNRILNLNNSVEATLDIDVIDKNHYEAADVNDDILKFLNQKEFEMFKWSISPSFLEILNK